MDTYNKISNLSNHLKNMGFLQEAHDITSMMDKLAKFSDAELAAEELHITPIKYPASGAIEDVNKILEEGAYMLNVYRQMENYVDMSSGHLLERADYLARKYTDALTDMDKHSLGQMERDIHRMQKKINSQSAIPETSIRF